MEQKDLFEASAERLPYIECSPTGRSGPLAPECSRMRIKSYPTWIIKGQKYTGILKPDRLASLTGYTEGK